MKKRVLFSLLAIFLAGLGLGGVSLAASCNGDYVAKNTKDSETCYESLATAISEAPDNSVVTLLKNTTITEEGAISIDKTITLNMDGNKIVYTPSNTVTNDTYVELITVESNGNLTIDGNGTIEGPTNGVAFDGKVMISVAGGTLTYLNGTLTANGAGSDGMYGVYVLAGGTAIFGNQDDNTGPTITSHFAAIGENHMTAPANITIYGGTYTANATPTNGEWWHYFCAPLYAAGAGTIDIQGGRFAGYYGISDRYVDVVQTMTIGDNVVLNANSNTQIFVDSVNGSNGESNRTIVSNSNNITIPDTYGWFNMNGAYNLFNADSVAVVGNMQYGSLSAAIEAANAGDTVTVLKDLSLTESVVISKKVTLDLNGKTLNSNVNDSIEISSEGDLTITGNGTINGPINGAANDGKVVISVDGGKLTYLNGILNANGAGSDGMYGVYVLAGGTAIFGNQDDSTGPTITSHFAAIGTNNTTAPATIKVYGGTYTANADPSSNTTWWHYFCAPIYAASAGTYDIQGGTFVGYYGISDRYLHANQTVTIGESVIFNASSQINVFVDNVDGTTAGTARNINSPVNTRTIPTNYVWMKNGNTFKVVEGFTVIFNSNGGSEVESQGIEKNTAVTKPSNPTKAGYTFIDWYSDEGLTTIYDFATLVTGDITLYAKWNKSSTTSSSSSSSSSNNNSSNSTPAEESTENTGTVAPTVDPQGVATNGYTNEMNEAYEFAYANGITTMKSIDEAEMLDGLTRIAMAKMLSQYAINVLGKSPADVEVPNFTDVSADLDAEYANGVSLAYKLGIMGINMPDNKFLPYETVTRAQFGTALSRLLFGIEDGEDAYYTTHLAKLKEAGIITNDDPTLEELRGYVMLMLMRSSKGSNTVSTSTEPAVSNENTNTSAHEVANEPKEEQEVEAYFTEAYRKGQIYGRIGDLQRLLKSLGYYNGDINNTFDNNTIDAVFDFQIAMGILPADDKSSARGNVGPKTRDVLNQKWVEFNK